MKLKTLTESEANEIITWKYPEPYSFYNFEDSEEIMQELLDGTYYSVRDETDQLIGFFCYGKNAQVPAGGEAGLYPGENVCDIGLGMKPELTGQGFGQAFLKWGIDYALKHDTPNQLRLSVAAFNKRAIRLYSKAGFREGGSFQNKDVLFLVMTMDV